MKEGPNPARKSFHPKVKSARYAIVVAEWNSEITYTLRDGAIKALSEIGVDTEQILSKEVSGAFELPLGVKYLIDSGRFDGIIAIGCLVKGDTPHFDYISDSVSHRLSELSTQHALPIGFGLLTVNTYSQAQDRAGGSHGNKGVEAAEAVANLLSFKYELDELPK